MENKIISELIPDKITECSLCVGPKDRCMTDDAARMIGTAIGATGTPDNIVTEAKKHYKSATERDLLEKTEPILGERARIEILTRLKLPGPTDSSLLSNIYIDATLQQWKKYFPDFYPYNFNMRNYMSYSYADGYVLNTPDTLATILFEDLYQKYKCCSCVINSDVYQGRGKHWMVLFADWRDPINWSVEFFNSSGKAPGPEWVSWLEKTKVSMEVICARESRKTSVKIVRAADICHQKTRTECGVYSLCYIWSRLNGVPPEQFRIPIPDQYMFKFRQHLFTDPSRPSMSKFDWREYQSQTKIMWDDSIK